MLFVLSRSRHALQGHHPAAAPRRAGGFTLIELMIAVAIIGILAAVALPAYTDYVLRGKLVDATNALSALRARMEQHYQDHRTYATVASVATSPCASTETASIQAGAFAISCGSLSATAWVATADGSGSVDGFSYTVDQDGGMATTGLPSSWGSVGGSGGGSTAGAGCWIVRKGGTC